ncbi:unnamed protein product [Boreogadus saida]
MKRKPTSGGWPGEGARGQKKALGCQEKELGCQKKALGCQEKELGCQKKALGCQEKVGAGWVKFLNKH